MFALGSGRYLEAEESRQAYLGELQDGMYVTVQGQLAGKQVQKNRYVYELTSCMFRTDSSNFLQAEPVSCGGVLIYSESDDCSIGDILIYHGEITLWSGHQMRVRLMRRLIILRADLILRWKVRHLIERCVRRGRRRKPSGSLASGLKRSTLRRWASAMRGYWRRWSRR